MYIILYGIIFHEYHYIRISVLTDPLRPLRIKKAEYFLANIAMNSHSSLEHKLYDPVAHDKPDEAGY